MQNTSCACKATKESKVSSCAKAFCAVWCSALLALSLLLLLTVLRPIACLKVLQQDTWLACLSNPKCPNLIFRTWCPCTCFALPSVFYCVIFTLLCKYASFYCAQYSSLAAFLKIFRFAFFSPTRARNYVKDFRCTLQFLRNKQVELLLRPNVSVDAWKALLTLHSACLFCFHKLRIDEKSG